VLFLSDVGNPGVGNASVRFANVAGGAPVDIYMGPPGSTILTAAKLRDDIDSGSATLYMDVQGGSQKFFVTGQNDQIVQTEATFQIVESHHYTIVVGANPTTTLILVQEDL
jgi:hypothetical protein